MFLSIDPGEDQGFAIFSDESELLDFGLGDPRKSEHHRMRDLAYVVVECPVIYPHGGKADPNDLIKLARRVGRIEERYLFADVPVYLIAPAHWKGQTPKAVTRARARSVLELPTLRRIDKYLKNLGDSKGHNVYDAIGLGLRTFSWKKREPTGKEAQWLP